MSPVFDLKFLNNTLGAGFIGYSISCVIFGIFTTQTISFYYQYRSDPLKLKILVGVVWCIEFIHQTLVAHTVYHYLVLCFGSPIIILTEPLVWSFVTLIVVGTVSESIVKFCFIIRIWRFSNHNKMVTTALSMLVFAEIGWILGNVISQLQNALGLASIKYVASGGLATGALGDILLALAMCYYLRKWRTGYQEPDSLLNSLVHYALNTGVMTSTLGVLTLILYDTSTSNFQYMGVHLVLSKKLGLLSAVFAVSLIFSLSTRKQVVGRVGDEFTQTNDGLGSLTTITELARNVNVNPVEVNVQHKTINAGDQVYEVFDEPLRFQPLPPSKIKFEPNGVQRTLVVIQVPEAPQTIPTDNSNPPGPCSKFYPMLFSVVTLSLSFPPFHHPNPASWKVPQIYIQLFQLPAGYLEIVFLQNRSGIEEVAGEGRKSQGKEVKEGTEVK
ncbi:hypothetical protein F5876DRAFT_70213 [Lentinula aff. lateritia]|uniref:Uncharacterized protein n=1 Tax=Lentinula aff. lateritia TaxID=2804960 RepID=A0ACC1TK21_9AGAR|nr:hypothetical protein F5876DRAFT_70213 [Lentinula aff. lateritia]